jgi:hypothetical protein
MAIDPGLITPADVTTDEGGSHIDGRVDLRARK